MPSYGVSFELESNSTYSERYQSLMRQINIAQSNPAWDETTSFALVKTAETLEAFALRLYLKTLVSSATDILLVFDPATGTAIARGPIKYPNLLGSHFRNFYLK